MVFGKPMIFVTDRNGTSHESGCQRARVVLHSGLPWLEQGWRAQDGPHTHPARGQSGQPRVDGAKDTQPHAHLHSPQPRRCHSKLVLAWGKDTQYCAFIPSIPHSILQVPASGNLARPHPSRTGSGAEHSFHVPVTIQVTQAGRARCPKLTGP